MKPKTRDNNSAPPGTIDSRRASTLFRREWPLLVYPALVVAALAILYGVSRSIERELADVSRSRTAGSTARAPSAAADRPQGGPVALTGDTATDQFTTVSDQTVTAAPGGDRLAASAGADTEPRVTGRPTPEGATGLRARLRAAAETGDNVELKHCLDELLALGDDAVGPLSDMIVGERDATALWAAKALARIGTPIASSVLLDTLAQIEDGPYKEQLVKEATQIDNHDSWPVLLNAVQDASDAAVLRAATASLAKMADKPVVDEIVARYEAASSEEEAGRLAQTLGAITSPAASESLLALAGSVSSTPQDALERAAIDALANIGDAPSVSYLFRKLEASPPGEGGYLFNRITSINQPQAEAALRYAAAGSKEVSAEQGRTAAIQALGNYPNEQTYALLEEIVATEVNAGVVSAAARTLEDIRQAEPVVAANAATKIHEPLLIPSDPRQK